MILEKVEETTSTKKKKEVQDLSSFNPREALYITGRRLYQGCDKCKTEQRHYLIDSEVTCVICGSSYIVKDRQEPVIAPKPTEIKNIEIPRYKPKFIFV